MAAMKPNPKILELLAKAENEGRSVAIYNDIKKLGCEDKLVYKRVVHPSSVGVHRHNRDGAMVSGQEAVRTLIDINHVGVDSSLWADATAFEEPTDRPNEDAFREVCKIDPLLAPCPQGSIEISSVACTHFNQALCAAEAGVPCDDAEVSELGKLNVAKIVSRNPLMADAFKGLEWTIWKKEAEIMYPSLPQLAQAALNSKYSVQQGQDVFQQFGRAVSLLNSPGIQGKTEPLRHVVSTLMKANPRNSSAADHIVQVARKFGGTDSTMANELLGYLAAHKPPGRSMSAATWQALAAIKLPIPHFVISIIMMNGAGAQENLVLKKDIGILNSPEKKDHAKDAEALIVDAKGIAKDMRVNSAEAINIIGNVRCLLVCKVLDKMESMKKVTMIELVSRACESLKKAAPWSQIENPWKERAERDAAIQAEKEASSAAKKTSKPSPSHYKAPLVQEYKAGQAVGIKANLVKKKFCEGCVVKSKDDGTDPHNTNPLNIIIVITMTSINVTVNEFDTDTTSYAYHDHANLFRCVGWDGPRLVI